MKQSSLPTRSKAGSTESVSFSDGMLVTAEDLTAATRYPLDLLQVLVRSYFGCGIVCGLGLGRDPDIGDPDETKARAAANCPPDKASFVVQVERGVALDCHGFPLELCGSLKIDLSPDPCACGDPPTELCLAIRHVTSASAPKQTCDCCSGSSDGDPQTQCSRVRDHVEIRAFTHDDLPDNICRREEAAADTEAGTDQSGSAGKDATGKDLGVREYVSTTPRQTSRDERGGFCDCLKACPDCACCGEAWVLLGCVMLDKDGITGISMTDRRFVKPIECLCEARAAPVKELPAPAETMRMRAELTQYRAEMKRQAEVIERLDKGQIELRTSIAAANKPVPAVARDTASPKQPKKPTG